MSQRAGCQQRPQAQLTAFLLMPRPAPVEPEPCVGGNLTFHRQLLHRPALSAGAVRGQRVALDAAASAHAAAQDVVGVQVVSSLGSTGCQGRQSWPSPCSLQLLHDSHKRSFRASSVPGCSPKVLRRLPNPAGWPPCRVGSLHILLGLPGSSRFPIAPGSPPDPPRVSFLHRPAHWPPSALGPSGPILSRGSLLSLLPSVAPSFLLSSLSALSPARHSPWGH